jgi:uncharacterized protein (DUF2237 family)
VRVDILRASADFAAPAALERIVWKVPTQRNVFNEPLVPCSFTPRTGYLRDGCCAAIDEDGGKHLVCAILTEEFLAFSTASGNDLRTPHPEWNFPGLAAGDQWCLCAMRWREACLAGKAPPVVLESTNLRVLDILDLDTLKRYAWEPDPA